MSLCSYLQYRMAMWFNLNKFLKPFEKNSLVNYIEFDKIQINTPSKNETQGKQQKSC